MTQPAVPHKRCERNQSHARIPLPAVAAAPERSQPRAGMTAAKQRPAILPSHASSQKQNQSARGVVRPGARETRRFSIGVSLPRSHTPPQRVMTYNDDNQIATFNGNAVTHDPDGNLTSGPLTNDTFATYTYDARNRLVHVGQASPPVSISYGYDPNGNRVALTNGANVTRFVINPNAALSQVLMRVRPGVTNYYIYGLGLLYEITETATSTNTLTYHYDYRGSTVALTDGAGNVTDRVNYSSYATITFRSGTNDTPFLYNGRYGVQTDPNGLLYMRARYYNPFLCRFLNPDPLGFGGGLNFYAYADGNPISLIDPFGLAAGDMWYDRWGASVGNWVSTAQTYYNNNLPWVAAGALNTGISIIGGIASTPHALAHVGEGSGTFAGNPTLANSAGLFSDISIVAGTLAAGFAPLASANTPIGYGNVVYRYASPGEVANTGNNILNVNARNVPKPVYVTPDPPVGSIRQAVGNYQLDGAQTHIIAGDATGINFYYRGQVAGGSGTEWITAQQIPAISINRIGYNLQYGPAAGGLSWLGQPVSSGQSGK